MPPTERSQMGIENNGEPVQQTDNSQQSNNEFDYQRGYTELRPEYTRATQELSAAQAQIAEYEQLYAALQDPDTQAEALAALGFDLDTGQHQGPNEQVFTDPLEQEVHDLRAQLEEVQGSLTAQQAADNQAQLLEMRDEYIGNALSFIEDNARSGQRFSEQEEMVLGNLAIAMEGPDGVPDVQGAYEALYGDQGFVESQRSQWIDSKRSALPPLGTSIPEDRRPKNARERVSYIDERLRALDEQR